MKNYLRKNDSTKRIKILFAAFFLSCLVTLFLCWQTPIYKIIDYSIYDTYFNYSPRAKISDEIVVVDIDETSLAAVGQWPWARYQIAILLQSLQETEPAHIGLDIIFSEPDNSSLNTIQKNYRRDFGVDLGFTGLPAGLDDNDGFLSQILSSSKVVGARYFYFDHISTNHECKVGDIKIVGNVDLLSPLEASGLLCNIDELGKSLKSAGFINSQFDDDGVLRNMSLFIKYNGQIYPNLSLALFAQYLGAESIEISKDFYGLVVKIKDHVIPINEKGEYQLRFSGPARSQKTISAVDLLNGSVDHNEIKGKIVLLGVSAIGVGDRHHTIFDNAFPGIETHAVFLANVFNKQFIRIPDWNSIYVVLVSILTGIIALLVFYRFSPLIAASLSFSWFALLYGVGFCLFDFLGIYFTSAAPAFMIVAMVIASSLCLYMLENRTAIAWYKQLGKVQQATMEAIITVTESRDPETAGHLQRTKHYSQLLVSALQERNRFSDQLTDEFIDAFYNSVPLHDIGKVAIVDKILTKAGPLTADEFATMQTHCEYGRMIIESAAHKLEDKQFLNVAAEVAFSHHERWTGNGYPLGLVGDEIPLSGRMMMLIDVYDALISKRHYKESFSHQKAKNIIVEEMTDHFDPVVLEAFCDVAEEFEKIALQYRDN